jgi:lipopolysaccharide exporter
MSTLRGKVFSATRWTIILRMVTRVSGIATTLVVARVVPQSELGAVGALLILDGGIQALTSVGFGAAVVQMPKDPAPYLDTCWTADCLRGLAIFAVEQAIAPYWCAFFHVPDATPAMRVLAFAPLIMGFHSVSTPVLMRTFQFGRLFFTYASESLTYSLVAISLALTLRNRWALVIGIVASYLVRVIVSYQVSPERAWFRFDRAKAREMFSYTRWIYGFSVADFFLETADNAVTGRLLGAQRLAQYRMSYQLATEGPMTLQYVITRVALPAFASIQMKPESIRLNFRALLALVGTTIIPGAIGIVFLAEPILGLVLGPTWLPGAPTFRILGVAALFRSLIDTAPPVLRALNHTRRDFFLKVTQVVAMCALLYPAARMGGSEGVAGALLIASAATLPLWIHFLRRSAALTSADFTRPLATPLLAGAATTVGMALLPRAEVTWPSFIAHGVALLAMYGAASYALHRVLPDSGVGAVRAGAGADGPATSETSA